MNLPDKLQNLLDEGVPIRRIAAIFELCAANSDDEVQELASSIPLDDWGIGTSKSKMGLADIPTILRQSAKHLAVLNVQMELQELSEGLNAFGLLDALRKEPIAGKAFFTRCKILNSQWFLDETNVAFEYSIEGSNNRRAEEEAHMAFVNLTLSLENGLIKKQNGETLGLKDLLQLWIGAECIPPQGLGLVLKCCFIEGVFPTSNTCAGILRIPRQSKVGKLEAAFREAFIGSPCFDDDEPETYDLPAVQF